MRRCRHTTDESTKLTLHPLVNVTFSGTPFDVIIVLSLFLFPPRSLLYQAPLDHEDPAPAATAGRTASAAQAALMGQHQRQRIIHKK